MDLFETSSQSFIVRIWVEETAEEAGQVSWRGHITHALTGERHYFESMAEIMSFMNPYLHEIGIESDEDSMRRLFSRR